jgi:hypothetical protein
MLVLFVSSAKDTATLDALQASLRQEVAMAWDYYKSGFLREIFSRQDRPGAVAFFECESLAAAETQLLELPLVRKGLIEFQLIPLSPFVNFELLFADPAEPPGYQQQRGPSQ